MDDFSLFLVPQSETLWQIMLRRIPQACCESASGHRARQEWTEEFAPNRIYDKAVGSIQ